MGTPRSQPVPKPQSFSEKIKKVLMRRLLSTTSSHLGRHEVALLVPRAAKCLRVVLVEGAAPLPPVGRVLRGEVVEALHVGRILDLGTLLDIHEEKILP